MKAEKNLISAMRAGYPFFYAQSQEIKRSVDIISDVISNFKNSNGDNPYSIKEWDCEIDPDPESVIQNLENSGSGSVIVAKNWNWYLKDEYGNINKDFVQVLQNRSDIYSERETRKVLIIVSNQSFENAIPEQLQKDFVSLEFDLPDKKEIEEVLDFIINSVKDNPKFKMPTEKEKRKIIDSAKGLTKRELQNAFSFSLIQDEGTIKSSTVADLQAKEIQKTAGLKIGKYNTSFDELKGYENLKEFALATINSPYAKGLMLLGPPGTGKTHFCKALGTAADMKVIEMEMANLFGSLVGESEKMMKQALEVIKANAPCILFIDEIEKGLSGVGGGQSGDGGTTKRSMAQFLKFLSDDRPEGVYVIATCNDISSLPPEWIRAERWDTAPFFIDLPNKEESKSILEHYKMIYSVTGNVPDMNGWSGAEIKSVCRIAAMMNKEIGDVTKFIVPVSKTMADSIDKLKKWAEGKTIPASTLNKENGKRGVEI